MDVRTIWETALHSESSLLGDDTGESRLSDEVLRVSATILTGNRASIGHALSGDSYLVDMWQDTTSGNGSTDELVELFIASNGQLQVPRSDSLDTKIFGGVS